MNAPLKPREVDITLEEYEAINPVRIVEHEGLQIIYSTPTAATNWRADRIYSNEPKTLDWVAAFSETDVLLDVGANVGMYSIWAAKTRGIRVFACEPESQNYAVLNRNIVINGLIDKVTAYGVAFSDESKFDTLNLSSFAAGQALHGFEHAVTTRDVYSPSFEAFTPVHRQGCMSTTIDAMVEGGMPIPTHIKIDVDGFEDKVIAGGMKTLERGETATLLVEINKNLEGHRMLVDYLETLGYKVDDKTEANFIFRL